MSIDKDTIKKSKEEIHNATSQLLEELEQLSLEAEALGRPCPQILKNIRAEVIQTCATIQKQIESL